MQKQIIFILLLTMIYINSTAQQAVGRKDLLSVTLGIQSVDKVQIKEITLSAGQHAPLHQHPCPVVGYVAEGSLIYQIQGQPAQTLNQGDAFYEPANTAIARFDNALADKPLKFIAFYLTNGEQSLIQILPASND
ncbi:cupin domain-containing protein [Dyadobacter chenwenxiniae]|uniref:Cupin domain-containing protein n=1 Tax=Dyadobacter chenwenxiniae TaxID=2906456 RepID=A0A9X1PLV8_9BACT|nr:cupin domain-containing protein [Dyadobacter chenwenxiniae]MCF0063772.1 cupin domain-containing protein [Dyadobacter chenwenxiniae]UON83448.1 cupin domain-containing protein [Dyadobacter chenwenxiniae]